MTVSSTIAIIGAGPSGLVLARLLELNGITDYLVYERDDTSSPGPWQQGGTLDLHPKSGQLALQRADLFEEFKKYARWEATCMHLVDQNGKTAIRFTEGRDAPEIDRLHLRQILLESIPEHKVRWGHTVSSIDRTPGSECGSPDTQYVLHFTNGTSASGFRLIVGADGTRSKVRPLLTPANPIYSGKMYIQARLSKGNASYANALDKAGPGSILAAGHQKKVVAQQVFDGSYLIYVGLKVPEDFYKINASTADLEEKSEALRHRLLSSDDFYKSWAPDLKEFIENAEGPFRPWPLYYLDPKEIGWQRSVAPGVTLVGDAGHASTPFVGEGANCSMYDSVMLAERIVEHCGKGAKFSSDEAAASLEKALAAYEEDMFERGRDLIQRSLDMGEVLFAEDACGKFMEFVRSVMPQE